MEQGKRKDVRIMVEMHLYLTQSVSKVVLQKSALPQIFPLIFYYYEYKE